MPRPYRADFESALRMFARVSRALSAQGYEAPVLVGGGAVELYSTGAISTGDFDIVTARQSAFEAVLQDHGFVRPSGPGVATRGWIHPEFRLGFEVVSSTLLDGMADRQRVEMIDLGQDGSASIISLEDMIADRMGQFASGTAPDMLGQARALYALHSDMDRAYLARRIVEETAGDFSIEDLEGDSL
ncbi:hypothetical protein EWE75_21100 [Sphingomonas populi]|uniref:Nucleotidyltransferase family protein n=1 Tax=Sphingomonas populi TaxID=2484750 RepID=A0A4Q6XV99_9SPHN|nr:hypothetical protein [Sphingomonas populi]RZF60809.1 hypothetical protein EWE75_21100 [Sphingomonas populi]